MGKEFEERVNEVKKKFVLEFDEPPAFVYVAERHNKESIYLNGEELKEAWESLELKTSVEEIPHWKIGGFAIGKKEDN